MNNKLIIFFAAILFVGTYAKAQTSYNKTGIASFYADKFEGRKTANGEIYYHAKMTAAHRTLPFGTVVKVTNLDNNKYVVVRINDRGPFVDNRIIDLSKSAAEKLGFIEKGLAKVRVEAIANTNDLPDETSVIEQNKPNSTYYKLSSKKVSPKGKGVQIGSYSENENIIRQIDQLAGKFGHDIYVEIAEINQQKVYRVIVGNTTNEDELKRIMNKLKKDYPDCFIVEFKN